MNIFSQVPTIVELFLLIVSTTAFRLDWCCFSNYFCLLHFHLSIYSFFYLCLPPIPVDDYNSFIPFSNSLGWLFTFPLVFFLLFHSDFTQNSLISTFPLYLLPLAIFIHVLLPLSFLVQETIALQSLLFLCLST